MISAEANELLEVGKRLDIKVEVLPDNEAQTYISQILERFKPFKVTGHVGIGHDSFCLGIDAWEFSYMEYLPKGSGYIFFDQGRSMNQRTVVKIEDLRLLGRILEDSFGMEYFVANETADFLIAVNWYVVEISGAEKALGRLSGFRTGQAGQDTERVQGCEGDEYGNE